VTSPLARPALSLLALSLLAACASPASSLPPQSPPTQASSASTRALAVADALVDETFAHSPQYGTLLRPPGARYDFWPDESLTEVARVQKLEDGWLAELRAMDRASLGDSPAGLAYDVAKEMLEARVQSRVCRDELWPLRPQTGLLPTLGNVADAQPVGTADLRAQALARFAQVPAAFEAERANLREGMRLGYLQADVNVRQILDQADRFAKGPATASPLYSPATRDGDPEFGKALAALIETKINPAIVAFRDFIEKEYLPHARTAIAVASNPDGAACYLASLRRLTTLPLTPKEVHESGEAELSRIEGEMKALSAKSFGGADIATLRTRFTTTPEYHYKDGQAILAQARAAIERAKAAVPKAFGLLPSSDVGVEPIPAFQERTAAAHYLLAALDGSRPGMYCVRLYKAEEQSTASGEATAFHETIPGHHLQLAIASTRTDNPRITRFLFNSGYSEGWALYAERVADELGLYSDDASRFGMLASAAFRAARLVVDSGIHAFGWDRERAIAFMMEHTTLPRTQAAQEVDRYISWPGQATAYMTGYLEIHALRAEAEKALGARFDLRAFHDCVLGGGTVPLPVLRARVESWIRKQTG
jgi:uncharacterized protein (DUF885 family)